MSVIRPTRDPWVRAAVVLAAGAPAGFVVLVLSWRGATNETRIADQLPWLVSGGCGGVGLIGASIGLLYVHLERRRAALHRRELGRLVSLAADLADDVISRRR
jgi:hypothetical protein